MRSLLVSILLLALTTPAVAQPAGEPDMARPAALHGSGSQPGDAQTAAALPAPADGADRPQRNLRDPKVAVLLSLGVTTGGALTLLASGDDHPLALFGAGALYFGPSTGHWYAGELGGVGLGLRAAGAVSGYVGFAYLLGSETDCDFEENCGAERARADRARRRGTIFLAAGATVWVGSTIADIVLAKYAADRWNRRQSLTVAPAPIATRDGHVPGVTLSGRF